MNDSVLFLNNISSDDNKMKLNVNSKDSLQCQISPMVIMSILNHFQRRPSNNPNRKAKYPLFVIGLLFGRKDSDRNLIKINDTFGMEALLNPKNDGVAVSVTSAQQTLKLHSLSHPNDRLVGWYRTGLQIDPYTKSLHDQIIIKELSGLSKKLSKKAGPELERSEYVHLLVDTKLSNDKLSIKTFITESINDPLEIIQYEKYLKEKKRRDRIKKAKQNAIKQKNRQRQKKKAKQNQQQQQQNKEKGKEKGKGKEKENDDEKPEQVTKPEKEKEKVVVEEEEALAVIEQPFPMYSRFIEITSSYLASESEKIGLDMIIESPPEGNALDSPSMLMNDTNHLETILQGLYQTLEEVENYVHQVNNGQIEGDESLGWLIAEALSSVPNLSPLKFEEMLSNRLQDFLMLAYLEKMTKAQLAIADKINKVLPLTVPGAEVNKEE